MIESELTGGLILVKTSGTHTTSGLRDTLQELADDSAFRLGTPVMIVDASEDFLPPPEEVTAAADLLGALQADGYGEVVVVAEKDLAYGLGRMFETHAELQGTGFRVFRDEAAARGYLSGSEH